MVAWTDPVPRPAVNISGQDEFNNQTTTVGKPFGSLVPGTTVLFTVEGTAGSYFPDSKSAPVTTGPSGAAIAPVLTAGCTPSKFTISVTAPDNPDSNPATYYAEVTPT
jgi:hypothetical protein